MVTVIKSGWIKIFSLSYRRYGLGLDRDNFKSITEFNISWTKSRVGYRIESGIIRSKKTQRLMTVASLKLSTPLRSLKSIFDQTSQIFDAENYHFHSSLSPKIKRFSRKKIMIVSPLTLGCRVQLFFKRRWWVFSKKRCFRCAEGFVR